MHYWVRSAVLLKGFEWQSVLLWSFLGLYQEFYGNVHVHWPSILKAHLQIWMIKSPTKIVVDPWGLIKIIEGFWPHAILFSVLININNIIIYIGINTTSSTPAPASWLIGTCMLEGSCVWSVWLCFAFWTACFRHRNRPGRTSTADLGRHAPWQHPKVLFRCFRIVFGFLGLRGTWKKKHNFTSLPELSARGDLCCVRERYSSCFQWQTSTTTVPSSLKFCTKEEIANINFMQLGWATKTFVLFCTIYRYFLFH